MNKQLTKKMIGIAASAALMASVALSGSALAGPGNSPDKGDRDPSGKKTGTKSCEFVAVSTCSGELGASYTFVADMLTNGVFTSGNPERDSATLQCKLSGADIKLATDKTFEAQSLVQDALYKIDDLLYQGKLTDSGHTLIKASFIAAQGCVGTP